jgi:glutamate racemase
MTPNDPIGVFDSGIGGLTVFREISRLLPQENLIYLGDTARLPYGSKSPEAIMSYSLECASFLFNEKIKLLVVACHTASAHALDILQEEFPIPILGVVQSGFELLMETTETQRVAILGTSSTIASNIYQNLIRQHYPNAQIFPIACPLFVPLAEENLFDHKAADLIAEYYLSALTAAHIDAVLLACTHYPLLRQAIQKVLGPSVKILEPARNSAEQVRSLLSSSHLLNGQKNKPDRRFYVTDHPTRFAALAKIFLGQEIRLHLVNLELNKKL